MHACQNYSNLNTSHTCFVIKEIIIIIILLITRFPNTPYPHRANQFSTDFSCSGFRHLFRSLLPSCLTHNQQRQKFCEIMTHTGLKHKANS